MKTGGKHNTAAVFLILGVVLTITSTPLAGQTQYDQQLIEQLVNRIQRGIQKQNPHLVLDRLFFTSGVSGVDQEQEQREMQAALSETANVFSSRHFPGPFGGILPTRDFRLAIENVSYSGDGKFADVFLRGGFAGAPLDSSALNSLSPAKRNSMSSKEKADHMRYRPFTLKLIKFTNHWHIVSFGELPGLLAGLNRFYAGNPEFTRDVSKGKK